MIQLIKCIQLIIVIILLYFPLYIIKMRLIVKNVNSKIPTLYKFSHQDEKKKFFKIV
mgnify:CR=1 FL=1|jgi:hypothetical protein